MIFRSPYWGTITKMSLLQRWLLVHSMIYYEWGESLVSDLMFDNNSKQLVKLQEDSLWDAPRSRYWYIFDDFDGNTGFDLIGRLSEDDRSFIERQARLACHMGGVYPEFQKVKQRSKTDSRK